MSTVAEALPFAHDRGKLKHYHRLRRRGCPHHKAVEIAGGPFGGMHQGVMFDSCFPAGADGFTDNTSRQICKRNAEAAGISTAGKVYQAGLAREGMGNGKDPRAWTDGTRSEIKKFCDENGCTSEGRVHYEGKPLDKPSHHDKPYQVAEKYVQEEVVRQCELEEVRPAPAKLEQMADDARTKLSGG